MLSVSDQVFGILNPLISLIFSISAILFWRRDTSQIYIVGMAIASLAQGISFTINHYFVTGNAMEVRLATAAFAFVAVTAVVWSTCMRLEKKPPLRMWIGSAIVTLVLMALADPDRDVTPWLFLVNVFCGIIFMTGAQLLKEVNSPEPMDRATIVVFLIIAAQFLLRPIIVYMLGGPMGSDAYRESPGHAVYVVVGALSLVLLAGVLMGSAMTDVMKSLKKDAQTDSLSGLAMRDAFVEQAGAMFARAEMENVPVSVIVADIDHFKKVNDLWGHPVGDQAIATFGKVFLRTVRGTDIVGRIGGEEFCVLVWNCPEEPAMRLAERLRVQFACEEHEGIGSDIRLTASFGVTAWKAGERYHETYERADAALYRAKRGGRDRVVSTQFGDMETNRAPAAQVTAAVDGPESDDAGADVVDFSQRSTSLRDTA